VLAGWLLWQRVEAAKDLRDIWIPPPKVPFTNAVSFAT
jgi:hypothetical protein